jgi:Ser/Thr protein kinase RdoA (MazF antagonist)
MTTQHALDAVRRCAGEFQVRGVLEAARPHGSGHIHDSYVLTFRHGSKQQRLLLQHLNQGVFADLDAVMSNLQRVTEQLRAQLVHAGAEAAERRVVCIVPTRQGNAYLRADDGACYRAFDFIEESLAVDRAGSESDAFEAGRAFAGFQSALLELPAPPLALTIPGFHDTAARLSALRAAVRADPLGRASQLQRELAFVEARAALTSLLSDARAAGELTERTAHNDAKLSNLLLDARTRRALCVVDLDTVMPGLWLHDFGDLVRVLACSGREDEPDPERIVLRHSYFEALARGYVSGVGPQLSPGDWELLPSAGKIITFELALRFLTDHLCGDHYFKVARPGHNLERARAQLRVVQVLERGEDELRATVAALRARL